MPRESLDAPEDLPKQAQRQVSLAGAIASHWDAGDGSYSVATNR